VLVADGDPNVRAALRLLLARNPEFRVVGESRDVPDLLRDAATVEPALILLDWELPGLHTGGRLAALRRSCPTAVLVALSTHDEQRPRALEAGVALFVGKSEPPARLLPALALAQTSNTDSFDVPQGGALPTPDGQPVAAAYGDLSVFVLNVAAGNDGVPQQPEAEQAFKDVFAQLVAAAYAGLSPDDQQRLAQLALLDAQLHQAWPGLPVQQRLAARDQWAASVQSQLADAPCELFDAVARVQLVPSFGQYKQPNLDRLVACWNEQPELAKDSQGNALPARGGGSAGSHAAFVGLMNANTMNYAASMNIASNIGGGAYTYTVK
jgi:CheY-like chemotaxis protein